MPARSHARLSTPYSQALCSQHPSSIPQIKISSSSLTLFFQIKLSDQLPPEQNAQLRGKVVIAAIQGLLQSWDIRVSEATVCIPYG